MAFDNKAPADIVRILLNRTDQEQKRKELENGKQNSVVSADADLGEFASASVQQLSTLPASEGEMTNSFDSVVAKKLSFGAKKDKNVINKLDGNRRMQNCTTEGTTVGLAKQKKGKVSPVGVKQYPSGSQKVSLKPILTSFQRGIKQVQEIENGEQGLGLPTLSLDESDIGNVEPIDSLGIGIGARAGAVESLPAIKKRVCSDTEVDYKGVDSGEVLGPTPAQANTSGRERPKR